MTALSALRSKAAEKFKPYELDFEDGQAPAQLKSIMDLSKEELAQFNASQKRLTAMDESEDLEGLREEFVSALSGVSDDKARVAEGLGSESLGVLTVIFEEYAGSLAEGAKSPGTE